MSSLGRAWRVRRGDDAFHGARHFQMFRKGGLHGLGLERVEPGLEAVSSVAFWLGATDWSVLSCCVLVS